MTAAIEQRPLKEDLRELVAGPRELWIVLVQKLVEYLGIFSLLYVITLWLSKDLGMDDVRAGWWATAFSSITSVCAFVVGFVADSIGFRRALIVAFGLSAVARALMSFSHGAAAIAGLLVLAVGLAMGTPAMNAAIKSYSSVRTRSFAFSLYYLSFNIGGALAGRLVEASRNAFRDPVTKQQILRDVHQPLAGTVKMSAYGMIYFVGLGCSLVAFLLALTLRNVSVEEPATEAAKDEPRAHKKPWAIAWELMQEKAFWRFMLFVGLLSLVKLIFQHYHFTWPKYVLREHGDTFPLGDFQSVNPVLIIFFVPIATALTRHRSAFNCIVLGSFISTASIFLLCLPSFLAPKLFFPLNYPIILASIVLLSIGEALWSPRLYEYTAVIAPKGREASYMGLSSLPFFFAKMLAAPTSGYLLAQYCPEKGPRHPSVLWLIIGLMTLAGPLLIVLLRGTIEGRSGAPAKDPVPVPAE